jgi:sugar lactone lactonase YvrE
MIHKLAALLALGSLLAAIPRPQKGGAVLVTDPSYEVSTLVPHEGRFNAVDGILNRGGKFYFADEGAGAIETWSEAEGLKTLCDSRCGISSPEDLVVDADGTIYFTDDDAGGLWKINPQGQVSLLAGKDNGLTSTEGIALSPDGTILVGDGQEHQVYRVTKEGEVSVFLGRECGITKPESLVFDEHGNLYITDNVDNVVYVLDTNRTLSILLDRKDGLTSPETIFYFKGALYITDNQAGKVYRFTPQERLKTIAVFAGRLKNVQGITVDDEGNLYVTIQDLKRKTGTLVKISNATG